MANPDEGHHVRFLHLRFDTGEGFLLSLGLFTFVINAILLKMASGVISGFEVYGFWSALFGSLVISVVSFFLNSFINERGRVEYIDLKRKDGNIWE